jgi:predicted nucleotidyltransferase component of viral defense system
MKAVDLAGAALTPAQRKLIEALAKSPIRDSFYLSGGTALAGFYVKHRVSKDLDFFTRSDVPVETLRSFLATVPGLTVESFERRFDRRIFLVHIDHEPLEVEFTRYDFERLAEPTVLAEGVSVDSLLDMLANKIVALADRRDPKDEIDLYFLLSDPEAPAFRRALELAQQKFGIPGLRFIMQSRLLALSKSHPPTTPPVTRAELESRFRELVEQLVDEDRES